MLSEKNMQVLTNIIGAVESGGQIYGKRNFSAYAAPYKNSAYEHTITLGWAQAYGERARNLVKMIRKNDPAGFKQIDNTGIASALNKNWEQTKWAPTDAQKKTLIALIDSEAGHKCQDEQFQEMAKGYVRQCENQYTYDTYAIMMFCEIIHLGGSGPAKRIFNRLNDYSLDAIMASLVRDQKDTSNNNQVGDSKYWSRHLKCKEFIERYAVKEDNTMAIATTFDKYINSTGVHYISNSGSDENGGISGGKAGDQTGNEWCLRSWYSRPWNCVLRYEKDTRVPQLLVELACKAALNNNIGYNQLKRDTYYQQLVKAGYDPSKITTPCDADCSSGVIANIKAVGFTLGIKALQSITCTYTGNMRTALKAAGFTVLTDNKYLSGSSYLKPGDILLNDVNHVATNITKGAKAGSATASEVQKQDNTAYLPGIVSIELQTFLIGAEHPQVKAIQRILNALGYKGKDGKALSADGGLGANTAYAIEQFQRDNGMKNINWGTVGAGTWKLLLNAK